MDLLIAQIFAIAKRTWKYRWPGLIAAWVVGIIGVVVVLVLPDRYEASARIFVDTQSILKSTPDCARRPAGSLWACRA